MNISLIPLVQLALALGLFIFGAAGYANFLPELQVFQQHYNGSVDAAIGGHFVPSNANEVHKRWTAYREAVRDMIGFLPTGENVKTAEGLSALANAFVPQFKTLMLGATTRVPGSYATFGPGDRFITKSLKSIQEKQARMEVDNNPDPIGSMDDALRGTLVVSQPADLRRIVDAFNDSAMEMGVEFTLANSWNQNRRSGYTGIHAKVYLKNGPNHNIMAEAQFHVLDLFDGTLECPKEFTHGIYEITRTLVLDEPANADELQANGDLAQKFVFLFGLDRACHAGCLMPHGSERQIIPVGDDDTRVYFVEGFLLRVDDAYPMPLRVSVWTPPLDDWIPQGNYSMLWEERLEEAYPVPAELIPQFQAKLAQEDAASSASSTSSLWLAFIEQVRKWAM